MNNIIFAGSSIFSYIVLKNLLKNKIKIKTILCPLKNFKISKKKFFNFEIKNLAKKYKINIYYIKNLLNNNTINLITQLKPSVIIVASYGDIFPDEIIKIPKIGCLNIHASLLPKLRGSSPIHKSIINNEMYTGITLMEMNKKIDEGKIIYKKICIIKNYYCYNILNSKLAHISSTILINNIKNIILKNFITINQNKHISSYAYKLIKQNGNINWKNTAKKIDKQIKAYIKWPSSFTFLNKKKIQLIDTKIKINNINYIPGQIITKNEKGIYISTKNNILIIKKYKIEGKKQINVKNLNETNQFVVGHFFKNN
jgi:methionyl-tRNA formyltransferase